MNQQRADEMTREEAIGRIQEHIRIHSKKDPFTPYLDKAFFMAIEALKAETKKCPICGSDLYEHCYMCCYEGEKVTKNE